MSNVVLPPWQKQARIGKGKLAQMDIRFKRLVYQLKSTGMPTARISDFTRLGLSSAAVDKVANEIWETEGKYDKKAPATTGEIKKPEDIKVEDPETYGDENK